MHIKQFEDKNLAHYSYAIVSDCEKTIVLIDPARNPQPYLDFAKEKNAKIVGVIETHPHADFISSHLEIYQTTGATIYCSKLVGAAYPHQAFDEGQHIKLDNITLFAIQTPGHSPDSICILLTYNNKQKAVFTGDTLFVGDCGRPDLRENAGNITATRQSLARNMYYSLRDKLLVLDDAVTVYPAHGAGTLCGKALSDAKSSTIGAERISNWSLQTMTEKDFVKELIAEQPFIPKYFGFDVAINREGASAFKTSIAAVKRMGFLNDVSIKDLDSNVIAIDTRPENNYKKGHLPNTFNIMNGGKFETWLGSIIAPNEPFYLIAETENDLEELIARIAKIGYETQIKSAFMGQFFSQKSDVFDIRHFRENKENYTIIDIRNPMEVSEKKIFANSINIPLAELRERINEIPTEKSILVHCAGGYRSAAGSSIVKTLLPNQIVYDLGEAVNTF
ncbi:MAG: MBL fold metallo-hydrolase [Deinococcales bacterium]|nr:MBL fold metallo-hydrolase [Chitinophagaceae bacterium]